MKELKTSEVLDLAADAIQMAGWGRGSESWVPEGGKGLCIEGGIAAVADVTMLQDPLWGTMPSRGSLESCPAYRAVREYLDFDDDLYTWNDKPERIAEEVIEVLRAAAAVERAKEAVAGYDTEGQPLPLDSEVAA